MTTGHLRLGEAISVKHGFAFPGELFSEEEEFPTLVTPGNFAIGGGFQTTRPKTFAGDIPAGYELHAGDLILTMTDLSRNVDTLGLPAIVPLGARYLHNQRIGKVLIKRPDLLRQDFLAYYLRTSAYRNHIVGTASGSTVRHTSPSRIEDFVATIPPVREQQAIAEVLGALDDKIAANTKLAVACEELALTMVSAIQSTVPLQDVAELSKTQIDPSLLDTPVVDHYSLPAYDEGLVPERAIPTDIKSSKFRVESPSVLVSKLNPRFPRIWNVSKTSGRPALASTEFLVLNPRFSSTAVLWACLRQPGFSRELESKVAGTSGSHQRVRPQGVLESHVVEPRSIPTQDQETVTNLVCRSDMARRESIELGATRDALLPQLMSGKLRVKDAEALVAGAV